MLLVLLRGELSSGLEISSLKERLLQSNQQNELEALNVFQEYVEETKQAIFNTHKSVKEREAVIGTVVDNVRGESLQLLRK